MKKHTTAIYFSSLLGWVAEAFFSVALIAIVTPSVNTFEDWDKIILLPVLLLSAVVLLVASIIFLAIVKSHVRRRSLLSIYLGLNLALFLISLLFNISMPYTGVGATFYVIDISVIILGTFILGKRY